MFELPHRQAASGQVDGSALPTHCPFLAGNSPTRWTAWAPSQDLCSWGGCDFHFRRVGVKILQLTLLVILLKDEGLTLLQKRTMLG